MKTSFSAIALALAATSTATKFVVSGDGYLHENGKQIFAANNAVEFQSQGSEFIVSNGYLSTSDGKNFYVGSNGDVLYRSTTGDAGFSIQDGKLTWAHGSFYACPLDELFQTIKLGAVRKDGQTPGDDCSPIVLTQV
ncbi:uncharacterized protein DSM5745_05160 [Aspergillus mulundensis]|uniref:Cell wall protein n=1 Tax=Aspergillus mulundensis TaxID=1810919 RepID=A0A3D8S5L7_9EURO|nr:hypothetical protein DSM5745_05160 [Aspergillus mulundensis]RDW81603.1 hypothetical protein DSM5745_05160 [Aspergillus mulundensis]